MKLAHKNYILSLQPNAEQTQAEHIAVIIANTEEELLYNIIDALHEHVGEDFNNIKFTTIPNIKEIESLLTDHYYNIETSYSGNCGDTVQLQKTYIYSSVKEQEEKKPKTLHDIENDVRNKLKEVILKSSDICVQLNQKSYKIKYRDFTDLVILNDEVYLVDNIGANFSVFHTHSFKTLLELVKE